MIYTCKPDRLAIYVAEGKKSIDEIKAETGADVIVNGGLFSLQTPSIAYCHLKAGGVEYARDEWSYFGYGWHNDKADIRITSQYSDLDNYICCVCLIYQGKKQNLIYPAEMGGARPRTFIGLYPDGRMIFYASDEKKTPEGLQTFAMSLGLASAVMLDGGSSTQGISPSGSFRQARKCHNYILAWLKPPVDCPYKNCPDKCPYQQPAAPDPAEIIMPDYKFTRTPSKRSNTLYIILHHAAVASATPENINNYHKTLGWLGIGYNMYIRKDGKIYLGRPLDTVGAHTVGYNNISVGICFEGNFENETMSAAQLAAGKKAIAYVKSFYPSAQIKMHREFDATACPGKNFPIGEFR